MAQPRIGNTPKGATASAQLYSLAETAKANGQEPYEWLRHALERLVTSVEDYEALLPWNCSRYYLAKHATHLEAGGVRGAVTVDFFDFCVGTHYKGLAPEIYREHSIKL